MKKDCHTKAVVPSSPLSRSSFLHARRSAGTHVPHEWIHFLALLYRVGVLEG